MSTDELLALLPEGYYLVKSSSGYVVYETWRDNEDGIPTADAPTAREAIEAALRLAGLLPADPNA